MDMEKKNVMRLLLDYAAAAGAEGADVVLSSSESFSLSVQQANIDSLKASKAQVAGIRVIKDKKVGLSFTEAFDEASLKDTAKKAVENSRFSKVNEFETIDHLQEEDLIHKGDLESVESERALDEKIELALSLESEVKKCDKRIQGVPYNGLGESSVEQYYLNSLGTFTYDFESYLSCYTSALAKSNQSSSMHYQSTLAKNYRQLNWQWCVKESASHALAWLEANPVKSGRYDIIFTTDQLESLFGVFKGMFSARLAQEERNPMFDRLNSQIADSGLTIIDSPMDKKSFFKTPFDSEGHTRHDIELIKDGVFTELLHNSATAKALNMENNFRAARSARSSLGVSSTTFFIAKGKESEQNLRRGEFIEVHSMQGLHSGANFTSGDFSFAASGYLYREGEDRMPVKGITVAGNFYKLLSEIAGIGNEVNESSARSFFAPSIRFANLAVAGR